MKPIRIGTKIEFNNSIVTIKDISVRKSKITNEIITDIDYEMVFKNEIFRSVNSSSPADKLMKTIFDLNGQAA